MIETIGVILLIALLIGTVIWFNIDLDKATLEDKEFCKYQSYQPGFAEFASPYSKCLVSRVRERSGNSLASKIEAETDSLVDKIDAKTKKAKQKVKDLEDK